jgi:hypothetical protein
MGGTNQLTYLLQYWVKQSTPDEPGFQLRELNLLVLAFKSGIFAKGCNKNTIYGSEPFLTPVLVVLLDAH